MWESLFGVFVFAVAEDGTGNADETDDGSNNDPWTITGFGNLESSFSKLAFGFLSIGLGSSGVSSWAVSSNLGFPVFDLVTIDSFFESCIAC